jgi:quinol monooxygenase YgiN
MAYVVAAKWIAKPEEVDEVARCVAAMVPLSRAEPGMIMYQPHRDPEDPTVFYLYEQYVDEAGYETHKATPYFQENVFGYILEYLEERSVKTYRTIDV